MVLRILDWYFCMMTILDLLEQLHSSIPELDTMTKNDTHSASTKFQDWHYKKYLHVRNDTLIVNFRHKSLLTVNTVCTVLQLLDAFIEVVLCNGVSCTCHGYLDVRNPVKGRPFNRNFTFGKTNNQQVLNQANTEGGRAQSFFVGPKTA